MRVYSDSAAEPAAEARSLAPSVAAQPSAYGKAFWCAYVANTAFTLAMALMYRYADFVLALGGSEWNVGLIVGAGMTGSLVMRWFQGYGIDHFGARRVWLWSNVAFVLSLLAHVWITDVHTPGIYCLRIVYASSLAGVFGASITSVSRSLPLARMAEVIGLLGTSGFIGMALGPVIGDYLVGHPDPTRTDLNLMFYVAAALGTVSLVCADVATRHHETPRRRRRPGVFWLLRRYHPGSVLLMGVVMGVGFVIPNTFLPTFIEQLGIERTGPFFLVYAITAFCARVGTRNFPTMFGMRPMIFLGLASLVASMVLYLPVRTEWGLVFPAVFAGISHAVLFPSVTAQGSAAFPNRYRGLGTTVMLAMLDVGTLIGAPLVGGLVRLSERAQVPPYATTFTVLGVGVTLAGVFYALTDRRSRT